MMSFSRIVKKIMDEKRLGVREIARASGMDASFFSKILSGKRNPPSEEKVIKRLARALGVDYVYLMFLAGRIPSEFQEMFLNEKFILSLSAALESSGGKEKSIRPSFSYNSGDGSPDTGMKKSQNAPRRDHSLPTAGKNDPDIPDARHHADYKKSGTAANLRDEISDDNNSDENDISEDLL